MERDPVARLDAVDETIRAASAARLRLVAEIDERGLYAADGATCATSWLAGRYRMGKARAGELVRVAKALKELPALRAAYEEGRISWDQLRPATRLATLETDEVWARKAALMRPAALWQAWDRQRKVAPEDARDVHARRYIALTWERELSSAPTLWLEGMLGAEQGAALEAALSARAERIELEDPVTDRSGARMADALVELAAGSAGEAPATTLVVHADVRTLTDGPPDRPGLAETASGVRLADEAVRRLACDAGVEIMLERRGRPVGVGRRTRKVPPAMARALRHRDRGCRFPGCERRSWIKAHHIRHWASGGATDLENLVLLCQRHHGLIHEGGWRISGHPDDELRFHDPTGRLLRMAPRRIRPEMLARFFP